MDEVRECVEMPRYKCPSWCEVFSDYVTKGHSYEYAAFMADRKCGERKIREG